MAYDGILEPIYVDIFTDAIIPNVQTTLPVPPASGGGEQTFRHATHPPCVFNAAEGMYVGCRGAGPAVLLEVSLTVTNLAGTQLLSVASGPVNITPGATARIDLASVSASIGTDLSYDSGTKKVVTTAGGVFMATLEVDVSYVAP